MKCPQDGSKITTKHYDAEFEWYECPKCGGCFTPDELEERENGTSPRKRAREAVTKALSGSVPVAKGKKRQTQILADEEAVAAHEKEILTPVVSKELPKKSAKDEVPTNQIVNIMADELQSVYAEMGAEIDLLGAKDKMLTLWRATKIKTGISAHEQDVPYVSCEDHA